MDTTLLIYAVFGAVVILSLVVDFSLLSKKNSIISIRSAMIQTFFWILIALLFFAFIWVERGNKVALEYISAYLMEWSLSVDNIFVFIIIFSSFKVKENYFGRVLLIGILMAIVFRIAFITAGVALVNTFHWLIYLFAFFLLYTGYKMFNAGEDDEFDPHDTRIYRMLKKFLPLANHDGNGKYVVREKGKPLYTTLFVVVVLLAAIDLVFALDSIPAVFGISRDKMVIYTSNIFAVLGLRSLFFLLRGAVSKFDYLQQGVAIVLIFIGIKMFLESWTSKWLSMSLLNLISFGIIVFCISGSIWYSIKHQKHGVPKDVK